MVQSGVRRAVGARLRSATPFKRVTSAAPAAKPRVMERALSGAGDAVGVPMHNNAIAILFLLSQSVAGMISSAPAG
jgi:hypothetical protein